jgi:uncharacterized protein (DUF302 family)
MLGAIKETTGEEVAHVYRTNVFAVLNVTRAVLPTMRRQRAGHIINFSSLGGFRASAGWSVYCSTKFAVEGITEALHDELAPLEIHATVVEPGFFRTDFMDNRSLARTGQRVADYADTVGKTRIFALIDHIGEAENVGLKMPPTKRLIFESPKPGTPLMLAAPSIAIDFPLKILIWEDSQGKIWVSYNSPAYLQERHGVPQELLQNIAVVETLAAKAGE